MNRLERLREAVDEIVERAADRRSGFAHLHGVAAAAALLALRRGEDAELAVAAGLLHDVATYETGSADDHAARSSQRARQILGLLRGFDPAESDAVCAAIASHSDKANVQDALSEVLKDADVLEHALSNPLASLLEGHAARWEALRRELALSALPASAADRPGE
ncbi:MAG: HD domain-containing protein [Candidatus Bipolaricaulia bacterium]